jgi:uncharacterized membrane protein
MTTARHRTYSGGTSPGLFDDPVRVARGLGWFSIGLGLAQIAAPRGLARMIGVDDDDDNRNTLFALGLREIASGVGVLARPRSPVPLWTRVGGDAMDLALLGRALRSDASQTGRVAAATAAVVGVTVLDALTAQQLHGESRAGTGNGRRRGGVHVSRAITVNRPREEVYGFWRDLENLPRFMEHLESVRVLGQERSHWKARAPAGTTVEWDAETVEERPGELIAWRSLPGADVTNAGNVRFADAPAGGTEVLVRLSYDPPGGKLAATIAKLFGEEPSLQLSGDLRRFKQVMELGEVIRSDATVTRGPHPARPPELDEIPDDSRAVLQEAMEGAMR